jgi:hypothetical protein
MFNSGNPGERGRFSSPRKAATVLRLLRGERVAASKGLDAGLTCRKVGSAATREALPARTATQQTGIPIA